MGEINIGSGTSTEQDFDTRDSHLVAALLAVGVRPVKAAPCRVMTRADRPGEAVQFYLQPRSECGRYRTRDLLQAWVEGVEWVEKNPEHPFAYAMACALNYRNILRHVKKAERQVLLQRGRSVAVLPLNASAELEGEILGHFGSG